MKDKIAIGALISGGGTNLQAVLDACQGEDIDGRVVVVGTDYPQAAGLERARRLGIPTFTVDYDQIIRNHKQDPSKSIPPADFDLSKVAGKQNLMNEEDSKTRSFLESRAIAEGQLLAALAPYGLDLLVLAGFMRVLTPYFIDGFNTNPARPRIMNIHPALLPAFPGVDGYGDTFRYGCKVAGCTVHFVDYGEDTGPIIAQRAFPIEPEDSLDTVRRKGLEQEWEVYPHCIQLFAQGRLTVVPSSASDRESTGRARIQINPNPT